MQDAFNQPPTTTEARIPARTRRQAMDWSLALASQGIQPVIEHGTHRGADSLAREILNRGEVGADKAVRAPDPASGSQQNEGWFLVVSTNDYDNAVAIIRQYRIENLGWGWRKRIFKSGPLFDRASAAWVSLTVIFYWLSGSHANIRESGIMDTTAVAAGEWWRLFTATLLHGDLAHLASNAAFGFVLLGLAMARYGAGVGLLAAYLAGVGGNVADCLVYSDGHRSLGASGVVMGALGLIAVQSLAHLKSHPKPMKFVAVGVFGGVMLFVLLGLSPGADIIAHLGGFVAGLGLGALLALAPAITRAPIVNLIAGFMFAALVIWTWVLALAKHG
jgi:rhomboid protease GluP